MPATASASKEPSPYAEIHPISRSENFENGGITREDILPALLLASRLLVVEQLIPLWWSLFFGHVKFHHLCRQIFKRRPPIQADFVDKRYGSTAERLRGVLDALERLASNVVFDLEEEKDATGGRCVDLPKQPAERPSKGSECRILLHPIMYGDLVLAAKSGPSTEPTRKQLWLAETIVHELAHAALRVAARWLYPGIQYYMPGRDTSEEGSEIEAALFGGVIQQSGVVDQKGVLLGTEVLILPWPQPTMLQSYFNMKHNIVGCRAALHSAVVAWQVSDAYVEQLFTEDFWQIVAGRGGHLHVSRC